MSPVVVVDEDLEVSLRPVRLVLVDRVPLSVRGRFGVLHLGKVELRVYDDVKIGVSERTETLERLL